MIAIDTNVLIYAFDPTQRKKHAACKRILEGVLNGERAAVITTQILAEFVNVLRRKNVPPEKISLIAEEFVKNPNLSILPYDETTILAAIRSPSHFWDALIAQTLLRHGVQEILTENVKHFPQFKARNLMAKTRYIS